MKIDFFLVDADSLEEVPVGFVAIEGNTIRASDQDLKDLVTSSATTPEEMIEIFSNWSNGYLVSKVSGGPTFTVWPVRPFVEFHGTHNQKSHGHQNASGLGDTDASLRDKIKTATQKRELVGGRSGAGVALLNGPKGRSVLKTGMDKDTTDSEYLASKVGKALGAPVPTVSRLSDSSVGMEFVKGDMAGSFNRASARYITGLKRGERKRTAELQGGRELAMLDTAIKNTGRHGANLMISPDGKSVVGIDHGRAFNPIKRFADSTAMESAWKSKFKKQDYQSALEKVRPLKGEFDKLGRSDWYDGMVQRLESKAA